MKGSIRKVAATALILAAGFSAPAGAQTGMFTVASSAFADGAPLPEKMSCGAPNGKGQDISPALEWSNPPAGTKSYALFMFDPEGRKGTGVAHWLAYNFPASMTSLAEGEGSKPSDKFTGGINQRGTNVYLGPCAPPGEKPHHYTIMIYATDLAPGALAPGMKMDAFFDAVRDHTLRVAGIVAQFGR
jgi:Raf kinase inhibitor-like YbhB/YbcL family protein